MDALTIAVIEILKNESRGGTARFVKSDFWSSQSRRSGQRQRDPNKHWVQDFIDNDPLGW